MSIFADTLVSMYNSTRSTAEQLALGQTKVHWTIIVTPYDSDNDDVPHGAAEFSVVARWPINACPSQTWLPTQTPTLKKWFALRPSLVIVSLECRVESLVAQNITSTFHFTSKPTRLTDDGVLGTDDAGKKCSRIVVHDSDPHAKPWHVDLIWDTDRQQALSALTFTHYRDEHPLLTERLVDEATQLKMQELAPFVRAIVK